MSGKHSTPEKTEFTKDEWREVARRAAPAMTDEQYDAAWAEFAERKAAGTLARG